MTLNAIPPEGYDTTTPEVRPAPVPSLDVLREINRALAAFNWQQLEELPKGAPTCPFHCTLAEALPFVIKVGEDYVTVANLDTAKRLAAVWGGMDYPLKSRGWSVMLPACLRYFAAAFDSGDYPDLIEQQDEREHEQCM